MKLVTLVVFTYWFLLAPVMAEEDCKTNRSKAARFSATCCYLTQPKIDPNYSDCVEEQLNKMKNKRNMTATEQFAIKVCAEECLYIGNGYTDAEPPFKLDMNNIEENLNKILPPPKDKSLSFMLKAYQACEKFQKLHAIRLDIKFPDIDWLNEKCYPYALQITTCVRMFAMQECPKIFYRKTKDCQEAQQYFKNCIVSIKDSL